MELAVIGVIMSFVVLVGAFMHFTRELDSMPTDKYEVFPSRDELMKMSKIDLEILGREYGIELDRRKSIRNLVLDLENYYKRISSDD